MVADAEADGRALRLVAHEGRVMRGEQRPCMGEKGGARDGGLHDARAAVEQLAAEARLERLDARAHRRLDGARRFRRAGQAAVFRREDEEADGLQVEHDHGSL
jgi:hypothetical protein